MERNVSDVRLKTLVAAEVSALIMALVVFIPLAYGFWSRRSL
jgi:hypothetical protein